MKDYHFPLKIVDLSPYEQGGVEIPETLREMNRILISQNPVGPFGSYAVPCLYIRYPALRQYSSGNVRI